MCHPPSPSPWDPHSHPIISEVAGKVKYVDLIEGITINKQTDYITGLSTIVVIDPINKNLGKDLRPMIKLVDCNGNDLNFSGGNLPAYYFLSSGSIINIDDGEFVNIGDVIAKIPKETSKTRDITGGLPQVADLFEGRKPKDPAILAEVSGVVSFGKDTKDKRRLIITSLNGKIHEELIPKWKRMSVFEGENVQKGEVIAEGALNSHEILRLLGVDALTNHIGKEVQDVYRLQGVKINDKHIEVILRQMLRKVIITNSGDTNFVAGDQVDISDVMSINKNIENDKLPVVFDRILLGITKASLVTDSFISAASFQETTRVLTEAAISGKKDDLKGLKENVIVGRLVPAGTGFMYYKNKSIYKNKEKAFDFTENTVSSGDIRDIIGFNLD